MKTFSITNNITKKIEFKEGFHDNPIYDQSSYNKAKITVSRNMFHGKYFEPSLLEYDKDFMHRFWMSCLVGFYFKNHNYGENINKIDMSS